MVSVGELFINVKAILKNAGIDTYRFDAQCIMEQAFGTRMPGILTNSAAEAPEERVALVREMVEMRAAGYPLQYILGEWEFYGYPFSVGEGVLIPRPDTEILVEKVLQICKDKNLNSPKIVDLCSGSGCIAITLKKELPDAQVFAVELSENALEYLRGNIRLNNADVTVISGDVTDVEIAENFREVDIIVSNPPYLTRDDMNSLQTEVRHEPETALFGGEDGLCFYREIPKIWRNSLRNGGVIAFETGINQHSDVAELLRVNGCCNIEYTNDTAGIIRVVSAEKQEEIQNG